MTVTAKMTMHDNVKWIFFNLTLFKQLKQDVDFNFVKDLQQTGFFLRLKFQNMLNHKTITEILLNVMQFSKHYSIYE